MNRRIRLYDINHAQVGDFEEIAPDDWRGVDHERSAGICIYTREQVITRIADLLADVYKIDGTPLACGHFVTPDRAGNIWLDHEYLPPSAYLPRLIPEEIAS